MKRRCRLPLCMRVIVLTALPLLASMIFPPDTLDAQGVTTAAVSGRVIDADSNPLPGVMVRVTNQATGIARTVVSDAQGGFHISGLQVGGPYSVVASRIGFSDDARHDIQLALGQNLVLTLALGVDAIALDAIRVVGEATASGLIRPGRTGAEQLVTEEQLGNLPTITRNFTDFIGMSPLVGGGGAVTSVGQGHNRFNSIQIDGALSQDLFGLGSTGQPGGQARARSISIEAVKQYQILAAPFDVRQSGFAGGLINAVTKSGTNDLRGGAYFYYKNEDFARRDLVIRSDTVKFGEFRNPTFGAFLGGPIIRDRAHFFISGEFEDDTRPGGSVAIGRDPESRTTIREVDARRFHDILTGMGVDPGGYGVRERQNPNRNLFVRVDGQINQNHSLTLRHNFVRAEDDIVTNRAGFNYSLDSNWYFFESNTNSSVMQLNSALANGMYNEFRVGSTIIRDRRSPNARFPVINVGVPRADVAGTRRLLAGAEFFSQGNELDQDSYEISNDLSFFRGDHHITVGVKNELFRFRNLFWPGMIGEWNFNNLDDLAAGRPNTFSRNVAATADVDPNARFNVNQLSFYGQTEWSGIENLRITAGLRYDHPTVLDNPIYNPAIERGLGRRTDELPSGNGILSPRLGFNWDVLGDQTTQLRGGAGIFTGRQPFVWLSNAYSNTGLFTVSVFCTAAAGNLPAFTIDPDNQPSTCAATGTPAPPVAAINLVDPDFQYPHNYRANLALDRELPFGIVGTAEFMFTRARKSIMLRELNVDFDNPVSITQGGREVYGTHTAGPLAAGANNQNLARPNRLTSEALAVVELTNDNQDYSYSMTVQAQRRAAGGLDLNASYTYGRAWDLSGLTSSIATSNIGFNPVKGSPNTPELTTSDFEMAHKTVFSAMYPVRPWLNVALFYTGATGRKYSYVYDGDVNADGYEAQYANNRYNDLMYVPRNAADITLTNPAEWADLDAYISTEPCLHNNRGQIISRNACDTPWDQRLDARVAFRVPTVRAQRAELTLDIFNFLNLLNQDWGVVRGVTFPIDLLELRGWDYANNRGIFRPKNVRLDENRNADPYLVRDPASRWQAQIGMRYTF
jgi:hypothetical protein